MAKNLPTGQPLGYLGIKESDPPEIWRAKRAPTTTDYRYDMGDIWLDIENVDIYMLAYKSGTTATWLQVGEASGHLNTLTGDTGSATPTANAISLTGGTNITTVASGSDVTFNLDDDVTISDVHIYGANVIHGTASTTALNFNGLRVISGTALNLANATNFPIANSGSYGTATLYLYGSNDTTVPAGVFHLSKRTATDAANIVAASQSAGSGGAVYTVTWLTAGTYTVNFQHNVGSAKTIYYRLVY